MTESSNWARCSTCLLRSNGSTSAIAPGRPLACHARYAPSSSDWMAGTSSAAAINAPPPRNTSCAALSAGPMRRSQAGKRAYSKIFAGMVSRRRSPKLRSTCDRARSAMAAARGPAGVRVSHGSMPASAAMSRTRFPPMVSTSPMNSTRTFVGEAPTVSTKRRTPRKKAAGLRSTYNTPVKAIRNTPSSVAGGSGSSSVPLKMVCTRPAASGYAERSVPLWRSDVVSTSDACRITSAWRGRVRLRKSGLTFEPSTQLQCVHGSRRSATCGRAKRRANRSACRCTACGGPDVTSAAYEARSRCCATSSMTRRAHRSSISS